MKWQRAFNIYKLKWPVKSSRAYFPLVVLADSDQNIPRKAMIVPFSASTANDIHEVQGSPPRSGAPEGSRTPNPQLRRLMLYPIELLALGNF